MASPPPGRAPVDLDDYRALLRNGFVESQTLHCSPGTALEEEDAITWMRSLEERASADGLRTERLEVFGPSCVFTYPLVGLTAPDGTGYYELRNDPVALQHRIERDWGDTIRKARGRLQPGGVALGLLTEADVGMLLAGWNDPTIALGTDDARSGVVGIPSMLRGGSRHESTLCSRSASASASGNGKTATSR